MPMLHYKRAGEWLELDWQELSEGSWSAPNYDGQPGERTGALEASSHPHQVRQWLLARSLFPEKWINRLFSVGGIRFDGQRLGLLAFPAANPLSDSLYRQAKLSQGSPVPTVLFEDDFCLVLYKDAGMPVHGTGANQAGTLDEAAARHMLLQGDPLPVRHIHRLDEDTSGPVLYSKNDFAQWKLDEAMRRKAIDRRYMAFVQGRLRPPAGTVDAPIGKDRHHRSRRRVAQGGDAAVTHYETAENYAAATLVRLQLETGRTHQIRVHMSHLGHPLLGDSLYGGSVQLLKTQALHGERLIFAHPWTDLPVEVAAPEPDWLTELRAKL
ncbi:RluA family pseudouridine synthase [Paenibacillus algorifonticola]|uniref:RluA family pseudouridine synthase n=1 Tax=Paenibacillus algorifonticola TaxID=684063 RepID=UPI003D2D89C6